MAKKIGKKINEMYLTKRITLVVPYRGKTIDIPYVIASISGTDFHKRIVLRSIIRPCPIPKMEMIEFKVENEFPTKKELEKLRTLSNK